MNGIAGWIGRNKDVLFVVALLAILGTIFVPLPPFLLDFLLVISVTLGVLITWVGLALAYFYNYPVGFYITTVAFAVYVLARATRAIVEHPTLLRRHVALAKGAG
jgi:flagellar biosynthesis component FlhA